jgi:hypothetical protein
MKLTALSNKPQSLLVDIISTLLILLFVYAGLSKLIDREWFIYSLRQSSITSNYASLISWLLPVTELAISTLLFIPKTRQSGLLISTLVMSIFTIYIGYMLAFKPHLPCSCGGVIRQLTWKEHLVFNILFTLLAFFAFIISKQSKNFIAINRLEAENPVKMK